jgi:hypothetical protein
MSRSASRWIKLFLLFTLLPFGVTNCVNSDINQPVTSNQTNSYSDSAGASVAAGGST